MSELAQYIAGVAENPDGGFPIPNARFPGISTVPKDTLNAAAPNIVEQQMQTSAEGAIIGFGYGRVRLGLRLMKPVVGAGDVLLLPSLVSKGVIDAIEALELQNGDPPEGPPDPNGVTPSAVVTRTDYLGTTTQGVDPTLAAAYAAAGVAFNDTFRGVAYTIPAIPYGVAPGDYAITFRALRVYDPRLDSTNGGSGAHRLADDTTWAWSRNPVLALAHFLTTPGFGSEEIVDWPSVITCADIADQTLTLNGVTQTRRTVDIFFEQQQSVDAIEETLRSYAGVFLDRGDGGIVRFIPDAPRSIDYTFTNATPANYVLDSLDIQSLSRANAPTVVTIKWTDATVTPWATQEVTVKAAGVDAGTVPWVESVIDWPGCQSAGMAYREAVRRLNEFNLADTVMALVATDEGLQIQRGCVVGVTDVGGFTDKPYRVTNVVPNGPGRWTVQGTEYQAGLYSDTVYVGPTIPDSSFPEPSAPPAVTGLSVVEEVVVEQYGLTNTRARLTWDRPNWPFIYSYIVTVTVDGSREMPDLEIFPGSGATEEAVTPILNIPPSGGKLFDFAVQVRSNVAISAAVHVGLVPVGKSNPPSQVLGFSGYAVAGQAFFNWSESVDDDRQHVRYDLRYGAVGGSYETASALQKITALQYTVPGVPVGTWRFWIDSIDSTGQYSGSPQYIDLEITDPGPFARTVTTVLAAASTTNMSRNDIVTDPDPRWVSDNGDPMGYGHVDTNDATGVWIDANITVGKAFTAPSSFQPTWTSDVYDHGSVVLASWAATIETTSTTGSPAKQLWLSEDGATWTLNGGLGYWNPPVAVGIRARYAYVKILGLANAGMTVAGGATLSVFIPTYQVVINPAASGTGTDQRMSMSQSTSQSVQLDVVMPPAQASSGQVMKAISAAGGQTVTDWATPDATWVSPLLAKGDLWGFSTVNARVPVGADGTVLQADSAAATGVSWSAFTGTGNVVRSASPTFTGTVTAAAASFSGVVTALTLGATGGRSTFVAVSEPYAVGAKYVSTGGIVYFGATDGTATPGFQISNAGGGNLLSGTNAGAITIPGTLAVDGAGSSYFSSGIVGFGTNAPVSGQQVTINSLQGGSGNAALKVWYQSATSVLGEVALLAHRNSVWNTLYINAAGSSNTNAIYVEGSGKPIILNAGAVRIGSAVAPVYTLDITGTLGVTGTLTGVAADFSGVVTATKCVASSNGAVFDAVSGVAGTIYTRLGNTSGTAVLGIEAALSLQFTGGRVGVYESVVGTTGATAMHVMTANTSRIMVDGSGRVAVNALASSGHQFHINSTQSAAANDGLRVWYDGSNAGMGEVAAMAYRNSGWASLYVLGTGTYVSWPVFFEWSGTRGPLTMKNTTAGVTWSCGPNSSGQFEVFNASQVGMYMTDGATSWTATSDERVKDDIQQVGSVLDKLLKIRGVSYTMKANGKNSRREIGVLAQEVQAQFPELVSSRREKNENGVEEEVLGVTYDRLIPILIEAIRELDARKAKPLN